MVTITLPDNTKKSFNSSVSIEDVAADIGKGLFKATVAGKVDGILTVSYTHLTLPTKA